MFNAEKLLGKVVSEIMGSSHGKKRKNKSKHTSTLVSNLKSGTGLMTAIGLGIGAYEILRSKSEAQSAGSQPYTSQGMTPPPPPPGQQASPPPMPPQPGRTQGTADLPPAHQAVVTHNTVLNTSISPEDLARRMIQVMIAAAHADGTMDEQEEQSVLNRLKAETLSQEEKMFLLTELHNPKSIDQLTEGITDPSTTKAMYMLAVNAIEIDSEAERQWLDQLAAKLGLSKAIKDFIEDQG
jgi:uncharacterized membrane protein YebE (DUF533 family)